MVEYTPGMPVPAGMEKFIRPEHVQKAQFLTLEKRNQFEQGIKQLWTRALSAPESSTERISACQKIAEVTSQLHVQNQRYKQQQAMQNANQATNQGGQTQQQQVQAQQLAQAQQQQMQQMQQAQQAQQSAAQARPPSQDVTGMNNSQGVAATNRAASLREELKRLSVNLTAPAAVSGPGGQSWVDQHKQQASNMVAQSEQTMNAILNVKRQVIDKQKKEPLTDSDKAKVQEKMTETYTRLNKLSDAMLRLRTTFLHNQRPQSNVTGQSGTQDHSAQQQAQAQVKNETLEGGTSHGTPATQSATTNAPAQGQAAVPVNRAAQPQVNPAARPMPQPVQGANAPYALSHKDAVDKARSYQPTQTPTSAAPAHSHPTMPRPDSQPRVPENRGYAAANKTLNVAPLQPVSMNPARPTLTAGPGQPPGVMGQPGLQRHPGYVLEGEGERVLSEKKLEELVREVTGSGGGEGAETLDSEVKEVNTHNDHIV